MELKSVLKKRVFFFEKRIQNSSRVFKKILIWFLIIKKKNKIGIGECNPLLEVTNLKKLSSYKKELFFLSEKINFLKKEETNFYRPYISFSSILFGLEQALFGLKKGFPILYNSEFTDGKKGIPINGLIWISSLKEIEKEIKKKIIQGFLFLKIKINPKIFLHKGFFLEKIKKKYPNVKISLDANGSFEKKDFFSFIKKTKNLDIIHSIEQPIKPGNFKDLIEVCRESNIPIALDEELINIKDLEMKKIFLDIINPNYIVLKPSVCGGFSGTKEWIEIANERKIGWWISSSLESHIGINSISQWLFHLEKKILYNNNSSRGLHGLNIGHFHNDFLSPLIVKKGSIWYNPLKKWKIKNHI
ncbi:enolase C-terminal domain-like protein [Blattabacterium cuenoti]|uniref:enolase C-terminal domain-like protein n=1 Tax=Blattabacterium cuenoti TaxID=1653831 RepID=UPI00163BB888|nr:enolase C-terminal domain-like protein [Blattabacterium cuenoti]